MGKDADQHAEAAVALMLRRFEQQAFELGEGAEAQCGEEVVWDDEDNLAVAVREWFEGTTIVMPPNKELVKALLCRIHCRALQESGGRA